MKRSPVPPEPAPFSSRKLLLLAALVGLATFLLYGPSLWSGFVYDAEAQIGVDGYIHDPSHFAEVLTFRVLSRDVLDNNRPIQLLSLMLDSLLWKRTPFGYHLTNDFMHGLNAALAFLLICLALRDGGAWRGKESAIAAALGALVLSFHPMLTEPVAEVSSREDVLITLFALAGLLLARHFGENGRWWALAGGVLASLLAVAAKESGVVVPVLYGAYWLLMRRSDRWTRWATLIVLSGMVVAAFVAARFLLQPKDSQIFLHPPTYLGGSFWAAIGIQPRLTAFLVSKVLWPWHLSADYVPQNVAWLSLGGALLILLVFLSAQALLAWRSRLAAFGALIFWLGLAPVSNLVPMFRPMADRYLYLPMLGVACLVAAGLTLIPNLKWLRVTQAAVILILLALAGLTLQRERVFANSVNLWQDTLEHSSTSDTAANNYGYALLGVKDYPGALKAFERSLNLPVGNKADSWAGAAIAFEELGQKLKAEQALNEAISLDLIYAHPDRALKALITTPENAQVMGQILRRMPAQP